MKNLKVIVAVILVFSFVLSLSGCANGNQEDPAKGPVSSPATGQAPDTSGNADVTDADVPTVKIAILYNMSGSGADSGEQEVWGSEMAVKWINDSGGIKSMGGAKIELVKGDTMSDPSQAKAVAERVLSDNDIVAVAAATGSTYFIPMQPVFEKMQIPAISLNIGNALTESGYEWTFQPTPKGSQFGSLQLDFVDWLNEKYNLNLSKVAILVEQSEYGESTAKGSRSMIENSNGKYELVYDDSFPLYVTDASSYITAMKNSGAEILLPVAFSQDAKTIFSAMNAMDYHPVVIGGGAGFLFPAFADAIGDDVEGIVSTSMINWDSTQVTGHATLSRMPQLYWDTYKQFPTEHSMASFNSIYCLYMGLEAAGVADRTALRDALRETSFESLQQTTDRITDFDETGWNPKVEALLVQWQKQPDGTYATCTVYPEMYANSEYLLPSGIID